MSNIDVHNVLGQDNLADAAQNIAYWLGQDPQPGSFASATRSARVTATAAIAATETLVINIPLVLANATAAVGPQPGSLAPGTYVRATFLGTCTSSNADTATFTLRNGTLGTVAGDTSIATAAVTTAGSGTGIAFKAVMEFTIRTLGTGTNGTLAGSLTVTNTGVTGIAGVTNTVVPFTSSGLLNTGTFLDFSLTTAATSATTIQSADVELLP